MNVKWFMLYEKKAIKKEKKSISLPFPVSVILMFAVVVIFSMIELKFIETKLEKCHAK